MRRLIAKLHIFHRLMALVCALLLLCACIPMPTVTAASDMTWYVYNGLLMIEGDGVIPNYTETSPAPWYDQRDSILHVSIADSITAVGDMAFYECTAMRSVTLPSSITRIGDMAFAGCETLTTVRMPKVKTIGRAAFSRCFDLQDVILPGTLTTIGEEAFYRCESLTYLHIPSSVTSLGGEAFAYCSSLLQVRMDAPLTVLPEWCFYDCAQLVSISLPASVTTVGEAAFTRCDSLDVVYYTGDDTKRESLVESIASGLPGFTTAQISDSSNVPTATENKTTISDGGDTYQEVVTTVTQKGDTLLRVEQAETYPSGGTGGAQKFDITINATISDKNGWDVVMEEIRNQSNHKISFEISHGEQGPIRTEVILNKDLKVSGSWLEDLVGRDAIVTVVTPNGSRFSFNGNHIGGYEFEESYDLSYTLQPCLNLSEKHRQVVGSAVCYWLQFHSAFAFPVTVEVFLDPYAATQYATLYERIPDGDLVKLNSAMIDEKGFVGFPVAVINQTTRYLLAMNVATVHRDEVLVPDTMVEDANGLQDVVPLSERYAISEPRGFMGMTMKEFTLFIVKIVAVFVGVVLVLVLFFIIRSKRKAKMARIRAEVMGTDAGEEYDSEDSASKRKKFSFKKISANDENADDRGSQEKDTEEPTPKKSKFSFKKEKQPETVAESTEAETASSEEE